VLPSPASEGDAGRGRDHEGHHQDEQTGHIELQVS
jgi:hypothetical protein